MILACDVHYEDTAAMVAGVVFDEWTAQIPDQEYTCRVERVEQYESGSFYKRELPCILALLKKYNLKVSCIVIDGYVFLDGDSEPGLGKHLFDALDGELPIVGVAKNSYQNISDKYAILRGNSKKPLYVTSTSDLEAAKKNVIEMHGEFRLPTLLKRVDQLCRSKSENNP